MRSHLQLLLILITAIALCYCRPELSCENCNGSENKPPIAVAGADQQLKLPLDSLSLDGSASSDPDGSITKWQWTKISGPSSYNLSSPAEPKTKAGNLKSGIYLFQLTVTDNGGLSAIDTVQVKVDSSQTDHAPIANAGSDQVITIPMNTAILDGSASTDADNNIAGYSWIQISGPSANLSTPLEKQTEVTALTLGVYLFELKVTDGTGLFSKDTVQIKVVEVPVNTACAGFRPTGAIRSMPFANLSKTRAGVAVVQAGGKVFFAGGGSDASNGELYGTSRVDIYDIASNTWSTAELSKGRFWITAIAAGSKVFFAGGTSGERGDVAEVYYNTVDIYDLNINKWSVANLSERVTDIGAAVLNNKVYFAGGRGSTVVGNGTYYNFFSNKVDVYDLATGSWSGFTLRDAKSKISAIAYNNKVYFGGGIMSVGVATERIEIYDPATGSISYASLSETKGAVESNVINNKIFWVGGINGTGMSCKVEISNGTNSVNTIEHLSAAAMVKVLERDNKFYYFNWGNNKFDIYDPLTNTWTIAVMASIPVQDLFSMNGDIYIVVGDQVPGGNYGYNSQVYKLVF